MIFFIAPIVIALIVAILATRIKHELNPYLYFSKTAYAVKVFAISAVALLAISVGGVYLYIGVTYHPEGDLVPPAASVNVAAQDVQCPPRPDGQPQACDYTADQLMAMYRAEHHQ